MQWLKKKRKVALHEALGKIKAGKCVSIIFVSSRKYIFFFHKVCFFVGRAELMLLGFISLLLTMTQETALSDICVPKKVGDSWHPCKEDVYSKKKYHDPCLEKVSKLLITPFVWICKRKDTCTSFAGQGATCFSIRNSPAPYLHLCIGTFSCSLLCCHLHLGKTKGNYQLLLINNYTLVRLVY